MMTTLLNVKRMLTLILDTETTNSIDCPILYNIACMVIDKYGNCYAKLNFIIREIFFGMPELMQSAYYANKIPQYMEQIANGEIEVVSWNEACYRIRELIREYGLESWVAHNARFDYKAMNNTQRYITKSKYRYLMPKNMVAWDTMKMAKDVVATKASYKKFCVDNGFMTKHKTPRPQMKAETLYRFITNDPEFVEEHKAMEDIEIEAQILAYCFRQHKKMRRELWAK